MSNPYLDETSYIDSDNVKQLSPEGQKLWNEMIVCLSEIENCLGASRNLRSDEAAHRSIVAAYLLSEIATYNNPLSVKFEDLEQINIDPDILKVARNYGLDEAWEDLLKLIALHDLNIFKIVSLLNYETDVPVDSLSWHTPDSLINLAGKILDVQNNERVADICCGTGIAAFAIRKATSYASITGYDVSLEAIALAKIRDDVSKGKIDFRVQDVFDLATLNSPPEFDKIFSNYPFGMKIRDLGAGKEYLKMLESRIPSMSKATSSDWLYNSLMVDLLSENGKAVGIMTNGSTWNMIDAPIRKYFIENGLVEAVIALPARLFSSFNVSTSMIVLSHNNTKVRLVDATEQYQPGRRINELSKENIETIFNSLKTESEVSMDISIEELRENDYVLNGSRYIVANNTIKDGVRFESVIKRITRGAPLNAKQLDDLSSSVPTGMQYLMLANIKNGLIDSDLPYLSKIDSKNERYCLSNHCLILSKNGYPYKVAVAEIKDGQKILANGNLYIIELDENEADPYYLAAYFSGEQGIAALKSITVGATIPNIGVEQLKKLIIPLPPLERQRAIAEEYQAIKDEILMLQLKIDKARNRMMHIIEEEGGN